MGSQAEQNAELTMRLRAARAEAEDAVAAAAAAHRELREARRMAAATTTTEPAATEAALMKQVRALCMRGCVCVCVCVGVSVWGGGVDGGPSIRAT